MNKLLSKLWDEKARLAKDAKGFTLIELLVVVVILGVLIAIAIPLYLNYRRGANDASAQSDMRNAINVLEQCNTDNASYPIGSFTAAVSAAIPAGNVCASQTINLSNSTSLTYTGSSATNPAASYVIVDNNTNGAGKYYCYSSKFGGTVRLQGGGPYATLAAAVTAATAPAALTAGCP